MPKQNLFQPRRQGLSTHEGTVRILEEATSVVSQSVVRSFYTSSMTLPVRLLCVA